MKKINLILSGLLLLSFFVVNAQDSTITFKFNNPQIISGTPDTFQFDVQIKCNTAGTYHRDMQIYFNYNTDAFGVNIVSNNKIIVEKIGLMAEQYGADKYNIVGTNDNTSSRFAVATESNFPNFDPATMSSFYTLVPTEFADFLRFKIAISDNTGIAGIDFQEALMNGGQYCQGNAEPVVYPDPSMYENDLLTEPTWNVPAISTWSGTSNTEWLNHSNWDNNTPGSTTNVTIPDVSGASGNTPIVNSNVQCNNLTINSGGNLTINSGNTLSVNGDLSMLSDANRLASLIDNGTLSVSGDIDVNLYLTEDIWHYVSTPISNALSGVFTGIWLKYFNEPTNDWTYIEPTNIPLDVGKGYAEWTTSNSTVTFSGTLNTGNVSPTLSFTDNDPHGFNFIGNPYPSSIDWDLIPSGNKVNLDATIYAWNGANYVSYNGLIGGFTDGIIPPMQGFFVHSNSTSPSITFSNDSRVHSSQSFYKELNTNVNDLLVLKVAGNGYYDETFINFNSLSTNNFDSQFDGYKLYGIEEAPQLYSILPNKILSINVMPEIINDLTIPIGLEVGVSDQYDLIISGIQSFNPNIEIFLEDIKESNIINLQSDTSITIFSNPDDISERFKIHFSNLLSTPEINISKEILIYSVDKSIYIKQISNNLTKLNIEVFDLLGNCITKQAIPAQTLSIIPLNGNSGYYLVKIISGNLVKAKKVLIF